MPQLRSYPQVTSVVSTDAFGLDRIGTGTVYVQASDLFAGLTFTDNFLGLGYGGVTTTAPFGFEDTASVATDVASFDMRGVFNFAGGTPGFTQNTQRIYTTVSAGVTSYVWGFLSVMANSATGGQNVAGYFQGHRATTGAGPTWGGTIEVIEDVAINNPSSGLIGLEIDNRSNGTDTGSQRVVVDAVATRKTPGSGTATTVSYGYRLQTGSEGANAAVTYGFSIFSGVNVSIGFDTAQATVSQAAFRMASGQAIWFDAAGVNTFSFNGTGLTYSVSGVSKVFLGNTGFIANNGVQVLGSQITGWGTPVGGVRGSLTIAGVTAAQCAQAINQMIADNKAHGFYGT